MNTRNIVHSSVPAIYTQADLETPERMPFAEGTAVVFSRRCPGKTTSNEDAAALIPTGQGTGVLVVADGMGGERAGGRASTLAINSLHETLTNGGANLRTAILDGIELANARILDLRIGAGTTVAIAEVHDNYIRPIHIGDSTVMLVGQRGRVRFKTSDHSPVGHAIRAGLLDEEQAIVHEHRHIISNFLGDTEMRIDVGPKLQMQARDTLMLASDGVSDNLTVDEIVELIRSGDLYDSAMAMIHRIDARMHAAEDSAPGKPDDVTFVLYRRR